VSTIVRAVPSLSKAPLTVRLIVVPDVAASALRNEPTSKDPVNTLAAPAAAEATPLPVDETAVDPPETDGTLIVGTFVEVVVI